MNTYDMQNIYTQQNTSILLEKLRSIFSEKNVNIGNLLFLDFK